MNKLTELQNQIFTGSMLGDGHLELHKNAKNISYQVLRATKDLAHLKWEANVFNEFLTKSGVTSKSIYDKRTRKTYFRSKFKTKCLPIFTELYKKWYSNKVKTIPKDIKLTPLIVAKWFADDGNVTKTSKNTIGVKLATHSFNQEEIDFLISELKRLIPNLEVYTYFEKGTKQQTIRLFGNSAKLFFRLIDPIFPPGMERKSAVWRQSNYRIFKDKIKYTCPHCIIGKVYKNGHNNEHKQKYICLGCNKQFITPKDVAD